VPSYGAIAALICGSSCLGTLPPNSFATKLTKALVEELAGQRRRPDATSGGLGIEQTPLLGV